jgi:hypothetical protein
MKYSCYLCKLNLIRRSEVCMKEKKNEQNNLLIKKRKILSANIAHRVISWQKYKYYHKIFSNLGVIYVSFFWFLSAESP